MVSTPTSSKQHVLPTESRFGWWTLRTGSEQVEQLKASLLNRGIRERLLARVLAKVEETHSSEGMCS